MSYLVDNGLRVWNRRKLVGRCESQEQIAQQPDNAQQRQRMLQSARYIADRFHCDLLTLSIRQPGLSLSDETVIHKHLELARRFGSDVHVIESKDAVRAILDFAKGHGVTQLFLGHSQSEENWRSLLSGNPLERLIEAAENMDIRIFPSPPRHERRA